MSRKVTIKGKVIIEHFEIARSLVTEYEGIRIRNGSFELAGWDDFASDLNSRIRKIEREYERQVALKIQRQNEERIRLAEEKRRLHEAQMKLEEEKRITANQQEILRQLIELEKQKNHCNQETKKLDEEIAQQVEDAKIADQQKQALRAEKEAIIIANAAKHGYEVKKKVTEDNKVKLVLQRREF